MSIPHASLLRGATVEIAVAGPLSGRSALLGREMKQAVQLAVDEQNASGGLLGARLSTYVVDDESRVTAGEAVARCLTSRSTVLGVIGHYNSDVGLRTSEIYNAHDLAMINPITSNPALTERGMLSVFRLTNRDDRTGMAIARYLHAELRKRRALVVASNSTYGKSIADHFARAFSVTGGQTLDRYEINEGESDFSTLVQGLPGDFDVLFYGGTFEGAALLREMRRHGFEQRFATGDGCWDLQNFLSPAGEAAEQGEGVLVLSATPEIGMVGGSREFEKAYTQTYGAIINYAVNSYDSARLLLLAIENAAVAKKGLPERVDVVAALRHAAFQGIAYPRPVAWDAKGDNISAVTALHEVRSGCFRQVAEIAADECSPAGDGAAT